MYIYVAGLGGSDFWQVRMNVMITEVCKDTTILFQLVIFLFFEQETTGPRSSAIK
jgi:hypothetical protein